MPFDHRLDIAAQPHCASLYRVALRGQRCALGIRARRLLRRHGYHLNDYPLCTEEEIATLKQRLDVGALPQVFIEGQWIGGYEALRAYFGCPDPQRERMQNLRVLVIMLLSLALAVTLALLGGRTLSDPAITGRFVAVWMVLFGLEMIRGARVHGDGFSASAGESGAFTAFAFGLPTLQILAGLMMLTGVMGWLAAPLTLVTGAVGSGLAFLSTYVDATGVTSEDSQRDRIVPSGLLPLVGMTMIFATGIWTCLQLLTAI